MIAFQFSWYDRLQPVIPAKAGIQTPVAIQLDYLKRNAILRNTAIDSRNGWQIPLIYRVASWRLAGWPLGGNVAQRQSGRFISARSLVRIQSLPPFSLLTIPSYISGSLYARAAVLWNRSACSVAEKSRARRLKAFQQTL